MRREARIKAMEILYQLDFNTEDFKKNLKDEQTDELAVQMVTFCIENLAKIDELITSHLKNYTIERLNKVDKAIIRLAVSEMLEDKPVEVVINEALELTKLYSDAGDHKAVRFNNRLLDDIYQSLKK